MKPKLTRPRCAVCHNVVKGKYCWHLARRNAVMCVTCADALERDGIGLRDVQNGRNVMGVDNDLWLLQGFWRRVKVENYRIPAEQDDVIDAKFSVVEDYADFRELEG